MCNQLEVGWPQSHSVKETLVQCFPTFFGSRHPYLELKLTGISSGLVRYKDQGIEIIRGTPGTSSRHPGWEPLP